MARLIARHPAQGDLVLYSDPQEPAQSGQPWVFQMSAGDFGDPEPVTSAIDGLLGSLLEVDHYSNRSMTVTVFCTAPDGEALAQAEQTLARYLIGRFELVWEPSAPFAQPVSFWIEPGSKWSRVAVSDLLDWVGDEEKNSQRAWQLTLAARPFVLDAADTVTSWALTGAQGTEQVEIGGVAPANAGLVISAAAGLGKVIAHVASTPLPYNPAARAHMTTATASLSRPGVPAFAGTTWYTWNGTGFALPASDMPTGAYELVAHVHSETAQTVALPWLVLPKIGAELIGPSTGFTGASDPVPFAAGQDQLVSLGKLPLPLIAIEDPAAVLQLALLNAPGIYLDELFVLWIPDEDAALITGDLGTGAATLGTAYSRLEVRAPTVTEPKQLLRVGAGATAPVGGSHIASADRIIVKPGPVQVYIATAGVTGASVSLSVRHAFHDHTVGAAS